MKFQTLLGITLALLSACGIVPAPQSHEGARLAAKPIASLGNGRTLLCNFLDKNQRVLYTVKGNVTLNGVLEVALVTGGIQQENEDTDINNNPIKPVTAKNGGSAYFIDALADDPDFGDTFTLTLPKVLGKGAMPATIEHIYYSRDPRPMNDLNGTCVLN